MVNPQELRWALARLPGHVREATALFRELTGFTAATTFRVSDGHGSSTMAPPVHPLCASRLRTKVPAGECEEQWQRHLRRSVRSRAVQSHVCPLGLRCACIPIHYRNSLVGVAKCVTERHIDGRQFSDAIRILELAISKGCQDFCVTVLSEELEILRERVVRLREMQSCGEPAEKDAIARQQPRTRGIPGAGGGRLVDRALDHIGLHYLEHQLTLRAVSNELGVTPKYLTAVFTRVVGRHMHDYILQLRMQHACRLILLTRTPIKQVAYEVGFDRVDTFRRSFRNAIGVSPGAYRRAFARS